MTISLSQLRELAGDNLGLIDRLSHEISNKLLDSEETRGVFYIDYSYKLADGVELISEGVFEDTINIGLLYLLVCPEGIVKLKEVLQVLNNEDKSMTTKV